MITGQIVYGISPTPFLPKLSHHPRLPLLSSFPIHSLPYLSHFNQPAHCNRLMRFSPFNGVSNVFQRLKCRCKWRLKIIHLRPEVPSSHPPRRRKRVMSISTLCWRTSKPCKTNISSPRKNKREDNWKDSCNSNNETRERNRPDFWCGFTNKIEKRLCDGFHLYLLFLNLFSEISTFPCSVLKAKGLCFTRT